MSFRLAILLEKPRKTTKTRSLYCQSAGRDLIPGTPMYESTATFDHTVYKPTFTGIIIFRRHYKSEPINVK
jgi:hypothetical protein